MPKTWPGQEGFTRYLQERLMEALAQGVQPPLKVVMAGVNGFVMGAEYDGEGGYTHLCEANPDAWAIGPFFGIMMDSRGRSESIGWETDRQRAEQPVPIHRMPCPYGDIREPLVSQVAERMAQEEFQSPCTMVIVSAQGRVLAVRLDFEVDYATERVSVSADELCSANCDRDVQGEDPIVGFVLDSQGQRFGFRVCPPDEDDDRPE
jgi:hypothetical protein